MLKRSCGTTYSYPRQAKAYRFNRTRTRSGSSDLAVAAGYARLFESLESRRLLSASLLEATAIQEPNTVDQLLELASGKQKNELTLQSTTSGSATSSPTPLSAPTMLKTGLQPPPANVITQPGSGSESGSGPGSRSPADFRYVLRPGTGFTGPTATPAARGTGLGATRPAIADWDAVPYQSFSGALNVGVVAFHINEAGIERVDFSANGGPWTSVREMALNPQTRVVEYFATLRAELFSTGPVEVRAIAYPTVGQPVVLEPLKLYADPNDTFAARTRYVSTSGSDTTGNGTAAAPFRTVAKAASSLQSQYGNADGGTIYLGAGTWDGGTGAVSTPNTYLTLKAAPGLARSAVTINSFSGTPPTKIRVDGVTIKTSIPNLTVTNPRYAWYSNSDMRGDSRADNINWSQTLWTGSGQNFVVTTYATDVHIYNVLDGFRHGRLIRNATVNGIGSNFFSDTKTVINVTAYDVDPSGINPSDPPHPDVYQAYSTRRDIIIYGLTATQDLAYARGLAMDNGLHNVAIVNANVDNRPAWGAVFEFGNRSGGDTDNVLIKDCSFAGGALWNTPGPTSNFVIENTTFTNPPGPLAGVIYR
ncbi:hypothetical protein [Fontivita pretiosa]|uniref:hypothetical protein n=1 Tax=Fontivita pretiosa TaxID=2989684 RepID=UPI003D16DC9F